MKLTGLQKARADVFFKSKIIRKLKKRRMFMRVNLTWLVIVVLALQAQAKDACAQEKITLHLKNAPLENVLESIRKQTGYSFAVQDQYLGAGHRVSISVDAAPLRETLDLVFKDQPYGYEIVDKIIVVKKKEPEKTLNPTITTNEPGVVTGQVLNEAGQPLSDASVMIEGSGKKVSLYFAALKMEASYP
jgi:hypothetical protein